MEEMLQMIANIFGAADNSAKKQQRMGYSKTKLELYVELLKILAFDGPMKLKTIAQQTDSSSVALKNLSLLVKLNLVEYKTDKSVLVYSITTQGVRVERFFRKPTSAFPI